MLTGGERFGVLLASGGAAWESAAVEELTGAGPGVALLRRCLDLTELLAAATTGAARVAVVAHRLAGLDADAVDRLHRSGTVVVVVADRAGADHERLERLGVDAVLDGVGAGLVERLRDAVRSGREPVSTVPNGPNMPDVPNGPDVPATALPGEEGRVVTVWGPHGAPGRTTVAVGLASELARRRQPTFLLDTDPYGGAVAHHLGITDEVSGLLAAARAANAGTLDPRRLAAAARSAGPHLRVLTGLPRPDRWRELRTSSMETLVEQAAALDPCVVLDAGPGLETGEGAAVSRDALVGAALAAADVVVAVATADPVGLVRAARALADLHEVRPEGAAYVVVNRWRPSLGWVREDVEGLLGQVSPRAELVFLAEDQAGADRALRAGRTPAEVRTSALSKGIANLADRVAPVLGAAERERASGRRLLRR